VDAVALTNYPDRPSFLCYKVAAKILFAAFGEPAGIASFVHWHIRPAQPFV
jgi:hypothetical protein